MKFVGRSLSDLKALDPIIKQRIGRELLLIQEGGRPETKPRNDIGRGVFQLNVCNELGKNVGRCFYVLKHDDDLYVLHAFVKKTRTTPTKDVKKARDRYRQVMTDLRKAK